MILHVRNSGDLIKEINRAREHVYISIGILCKEHGLSLRYIKAWRIF